VVTAIKDAISEGLTQKAACEILGIAPRKFRRWANPKPLRPRTAWNETLPEEREAVIQTAWEPQFAGKPVSHIYVHGHESGKFFVSLTNAYRILHAEHLVNNTVRTKRNTGYVSVHKLLEEGFSLLCYDATRFLTESGTAVWGIPVIVLPYRYLLHIGYSLNSVSSADLVRTVKEAYALLPELANKNLIAHSDRGSAMKAAVTKRIVKDLLGAPVHYGRPNTPDDEAWIEAFIKTLKYHRETPQSFAQADDVVQWFNRFPDIYNNDPHSSLKYVTPAQALAGKMEVILGQRKCNLRAARVMRHAAWKLKSKGGALQELKEVAILSE